MKTQRSVDTYKSDYMFWESVQALLSVLVPVQRVDFTYCFLHDNRKDCRDRIGVCYVNSNCSKEAKLFMTSVIRWAAETPNNFLPVGNLLYCIGQGRFWGARELSDYIMHISTNDPEIRGWTEKLRERYLKARKIHGYEKIVDDFNYPIQVAIEYSVYKRIVDPMYLRLCRYVKRHYDKRRFGTNAQERATMQAILVNALWAYNNKINGLMCQMPANVANVKMIDDTLFFSDTKRAITKQEFDFNSLSWSLNPYMKRTMISLLQNYQSFLYQQRKDPALREIIIDSDELTGIVFDTSQKLLWVSYNKELDKFNAEKPREHTYYKTVLLNPNSLARFQSSEIQNISSINTLFHITKGKTDLLDELARISCYCCCTEKRFSGAIVLNDQYKDFYTAALQPFNQSYFDLGDFSLQNTINGLITKKINKLPVICCIDSKKRMHPEQKTRLSKVVRGATITVPDSILGRKKHKNNAQFFVLGNENTVKKLEGIGIKCLVPCIQPTAAPFHCNEIWLKVILPLWGILLEEKTRPPKKKNTSGTVDAFLKCCCEFSSKNEYVEARALYESYRAYCTNLGTDYALLFKDFNAYIEKNHGLKRKQRHKSEHESPTVFYGIKLSNAPGKPINSSDQKPKDMNHEYLEFFNYALHVFSEVYSRFEEFPWEASIDDSTLGVLKCLSGKLIVEPT